HASVWRNGRAAGTRAGRGHTRGNGRQPVFRRRAGATPAGGGSRPGRPGAGGRATGRAGGRTPGGGAADRAPERRSSTCPRTGAALAYGGLGGRSSADARVYAARRSGG